MCGFTLHIFEQKLTNKLIKSCIDSSLKISHRGPDNFRVEVISRINAVICFHRLSVNDTSIRGNQPFVKSHGGNDYYLACNGEIYNHVEMEKNLENELTSRSDCEFIINELIQTDMNPNTSIYNSEHAFVGICVYSDNSYKLIASTDRFGIRPLFTSKFESDKIKGMGFSSELQGLVQFPDYTVERFNSSANFYKSNIEKTIKYYDIRKIRERTTDEISFSDAVLEVRSSLMEAVRARLMSDRKIGFFLSGGLDSTCVCICAKEILGNETLNTFSIGFPGSDDEIYAKKVAKQLGTNHTHFVLTKKNYLKAIRNVVECNGSFDTTTTRASIGQFKCSEKISKTDIVVMLSGDGSDEVNFSYDDSLHCPDFESFIEITYHLLENIHTSDGLRADRCVSHFGLELRLPFLDHNFVETILSLPVEYRFPQNGVTKRLLREAFRSYVTDEIIDRPKVTFSDGIGNKNDQTRTLLTNHFSDMYTSEQFNELRLQYSYHLFQQQMKNYIIEKYSQINSEKKNQLQEQFLIFGKQCLKHHPIQAHGILNRM